VQADEKAIIDYLKGWQSSFVSAKEIARKVGGKGRYADDRGWALPILAQLVRDGVLETNQLGGFKLKQEDVRKKRHEKHVSPQLLKILKSSGKSFDGIIIDTEDGEALPYGKPFQPTPRPGEQAS
jgi:hypothetical protein